MLERQIEQLTSDVVSDGYVMSANPAESKRKVRHRPQWTRDPFTLAVVCRHPVREVYAKWMRIASSYFLLNRSAAQIADESGMTTKAVQRLIERLNSRGANMLAFAKQLKEEVKPFLRPRDSRRAVPSL